MGFFSHNSDQGQAHEQLSNYNGSEEHKASMTHEVLAGAAAYEAEKAYERHCEANGQPASHDEAKKLLAGFAAAFIDREVETKGLDFLDTEKAKRQAAQHTQQLADNQFGY